MRAYKLHLRVALVSILHTAVDCLRGANKPPDISELDYRTTCSKARPEQGKSFCRMKLSHSLLVKLNPREEIKITLSIRCYTASEFGTIQS